MYETKQSNEDSHATERRDFLKKVGKASAVAPAVLLLMSTTSLPVSAQAQSPYSESGGGSGSS